MRRKVGSRATGVRAEQRCASEGQTRRRKKLEIDVKDFGVGTSSANFSLQQGVLALPWPCDVALREDALTLLRSLPDGCTPLVFFDPQYREVLDRLAYGNEGARQRERCALPAMTSGYIDACCREIARVLQPSGYLMLWGDTFRLCEGAHHRARRCRPSASI